MNNKVICYFNFQKNKIKVDIIGGTIYSDGRYSKQFCELDDFKKISTRDINYGRMEKLNNLNIVFRLVMRMK